MILREFFDYYFNSVEPDVLSIYQQLMPESVIYQVAMKVCSPE